MAMPYDAENVARLRGMLQKARAQNLSAGLRARRKPEGISRPALRNIRRRRFALLL